MSLVAKLQETNYINAEVAGCGVFKDFLFLFFFLLLAVISDVKMGRLFFLLLLFHNFFLPLCHPSKTLNELNMGLRMPHYQQHYRALPNCYYS